MLRRGRKSGDTGGYTPLDTSIPSITIGSERIHGTSLLGGGNRPSKGKSQKPGKRPKIRNTRSSERWPLPVRIAAGAAAGALALSGIAAVGISLAPEQTARSSTCTKTGLCDFFLGKIVDHTPPMTVESDAKFNLPKAKDGKTVVSNLGTYAILTAKDFDIPPSSKVLPFIYESRTFCANGDKKCDNPVTVRDIRVPVSFTPSADFDLAVPGAPKKISARMYAGLISTPLKGQPNNQQSCVTDLDRLVEEFKLHADSMAGGNEEVAKTLRSADNPYDDNPVTDPLVPRIGLFSLESGKAPYGPISPSMSALTSASVVRANVVCQPPVSKR